MEFPKFDEAASLRWTRGKDRPTIVLVERILLTQLAMTNLEPIAVPGRPPAAPVELAGQWVAWDKQRAEIIAHGHDVAAVRAAAQGAGFPDAILEKVRQPGATFIGAA